jgi:predicted RNase H-like HicB family nuclease
MKYAIIIETTDDGTYGAYAPDLPGVGVTAETADEARSLLSEAIAMHLEGLAADGLPIPQPTVEIGYVETPAA